MSVSKSQRCQAEGTLAVRELDWAAEPQDQQVFLKLDRRADLIVCSDCLYSSASVQPLLRVLDEVSFSWPCSLLLTAE